MEDGAAGERSSDFRRARQFPSRIRSIIWVMFGWQVTIWAVFLRVVLGLHFTWLVNSAMHLLGSRRFPTADDSRNSFWVAILTFGEGWHNNQHAHMYSGRHGLRWWEIDMNWYGIRCCVCWVWQPT